ncbi:hypothetical protein B5F40_01860 [Gordonibacter sp. An230]|uniref:FeoB-associated Cys-rich membrane protein n=1 Tax=Gordonibacter sp. An230 TaxID=1965592 RepID=UPI000B372BBB|nr:FeoB-associated Cys-rich membrane protein [Gordonibacter sp. An230]OUO92160.1 hypothetical protein B5F40_01860 [Gordonibacter sp. An230]
MLVSTTVVGLVVAGLAFLSVRRLWRNGLCDCRKDGSGAASCAGGCAGCSGCAAAARMAADLERAVEADRCR